MDLETGSGLQVDSRAEARAVRRQKCPRGACSFLARQSGPVFARLDGFQVHMRQRKQRRAVVGAKAQVTWVTVTGKYDAWPKRAFQVPREWTPCFGGTLATDAMGLPSGCRDEVLRNIHGQDTCQWHASWKLGARAQRFEGGDQQGCDGRWNMKVSAAWSVPTNKRSTLFCGRARGLLFGG